MQEMQETLARSLGPEDALEEEMTTHPVFLSGEFHGQRSLEGYGPWGCKESNTTERLSTVSDFSHLLKQSLDLVNIS